MWPTPRAGRFPAPGNGGGQRGGARPVEDFQGGGVDLRGCPVDDADGQVLAVADLLGQGEVAVVLEPAVEGARASGKLMRSRGTLRGSPRPLPLEVGGGEKRKGTLGSAGSSP